MFLSLHSDCASIEGAERNTDKSKFTTSSILFPFYCAELCCIQEKIVKSIQTGSIHAYCFAIVATAIITRGNGTTKYYMMHCWCTQ